MINIAPLVVLLLGAQQVAAQLGVNGDGTAEYNYKSKGYPTIAVMFGCALIAWAAHTGRQAGGGRADVRSSSSKAFLAINAMTTCSAIFFAFGPGLPGPAVNTLSLLFFFSSALGFYVFFTDSAPALLAWFILSFVQLFGLLGMLPWLSLGSPIVNLSYEGCIVYFRSDSERCRDAGYLQFLRTWGMFTIFTLVVGLSQTLHRVNWSAFSNPASVSLASQGVGATSDAYVPPQGAASYSDKNYQPVSAVSSVPIRTPSGLDSSPSFQSDPAVGAPRVGGDGYAAI